MKTIDYISKRTINVYPFIVHDECSISRRLKLIKEERTKSLWWSVLRAWPVWTFSKRSDGQSTTVLPSTATLGRQESTSALTDFQLFEKSRKVSLVREIPTTENLGTRRSEILSLGRCRTIRKTIARQEPRERRRNVHEITRILCVDGVQTKARSSRRGPASFQQARKKLVRSNKVTQTVFVDTRVVVRREFLLLFKRHRENASRKRKLKWKPLLRPVLS